MDIVYTNEKNIEKGIGIFLAGPTPRDKNIPSWRPEALKIFEKLGFEGTIYIPELREKSYYDSETSFNEMKWDQIALENSKVVMFWIPRNNEMLGLSTNIEFGYLINKGNIVYGRPKDAIRCEFLDFLYKEKLGKEYSITLEDTIKEAIKLFKERKN